MDHLNPYTDMLQYVLWFFFFKSSLNPTSLSITPRLFTSSQKMSQRCQHYLPPLLHISLNRYVHILLTYTSQTIKFTPSKGTVQWFLAYSQVVQPSPISNSRTCSSPQEETPRPLAVAPLFQLRPPAPGNFLSLWICLVWTSFITEIVQLLPKVQQRSLYKVSPYKCFFQEIWFCPSLLPIPQIWMVWWLILCVTLTTPRGTQIFD